MRFSSRSRSRPRSVSSGFLLELALDDIGQERVQLGAHQVVAVRARLAHRADGGAGVQHVADLDGALGVELVEPHLVGEAVHRLARMHGAQREARVLEDVGQQRRLDDGLELMGAARLGARHVGQRRAQRLGAEQAAT